MKDKIANLIIGACLVSMGGLVLASIGRGIYLDETAVARVIQSEKSGWFGTGRKLLGYDDNHDGVIDRVKERYIWYGSHAAAPCERDYTSRDKEFSGLKSLLDNNKKD